MEENIIDAELVRVFSDLLVGHGLDHSKGRTLYARVADIVSNKTREICKHFTDTCPCCIEHHQRARPTARLCPIVTNGFNTCDQVDLIDFQSSMYIKHPNKEFCEYYQSLLTAVDTTNEDDKEEHENVCKVVKMTKAAMSMKKNVMKRVGKD